MLYYFIIGLILFLLITFADTSRVKAAALAAHAIHNMSVPVVILEMSIWVFILLFCLVGWPFFIYKAVFS